MAGRGGEGGKQLRRQFDDVAGDAIGEAVAVGAAPHHHLAILVPEERGVDQLGFRHQSARRSGPSGSAHVAGAEPNAIESANPAHHKTLLTWNVATP